MDFLDPRLSHYAELFSSAENNILAELNRETHAKILMPRMLSGHLQGRILSMFSYMLKPSLILEIGTYTGYSAICLAEGLKENGLLHTIDINDELTPLVNSYIKKAGFSEKIKTHSGNALEIIPGIEGNFDLVFIDADKVNYSNYFDMVFERVRPGGIIIADNVLWSGKVLEPAEDMDKDTRAIHSFNQKVRSDGRVECVLLPVRDGLLVIRKIDRSF
jgi:predicted O-methyltransferase YrrM